MRALRFVIYACLAALAAVLLVRMATIVDVMSTDADFVAPVVMGQIADRYTDAQFVTGRLGWWEGAWAVQAMRPLPGTTLLALWLPVLLFIAAMVALAAQARRLWGTPAAAALLGVVFSVHAFTWIHQASWSARGPSWIALALIGVILVLAATPDGLRPWGARIFAALAVLHAGAAMSGDTLLVAVLLASLGFVALGALILRLKRAAIAALALGASSALAAVGFRSLAESLGYLNQQQATRVLPSDRWADAAGETVEAFERIWTMQPEEGFARTPGLLALLLLIAIVVAGAVALFTRGKRPERRLDDRQRIWVLFWTAALGASVGAFWLADAAHAGDPVIRYFFGAPVAFAALATAAWGTQARIVPALVCALTLAGAVNLATWDSGPGSDGFRVNPSEVEAVAQEFDVSRGYTSYWSAYPLTTATDFGVDVTPVGGCNAQPSYRLCTMYLHYIDQAYAPRPGRSFLITEHSPEAIAGFGPAWTRDLPDNFPKPIAQRPIGETATMHIFEADIAPALLGNAGLNDPRIGKGGPLEPVG